MARIWPTVTPVADEPVATDPFNEMLMEHLEGFNGTINEAQLDTSMIAFTKLAANACNKFSTTGLISAAAVKGVADIYAETWNLVDGCTLTLECEDGTLSGAFSGEIYKYGANDNITSDPRVNQYRVGIFLDGAIIFDTDHINEGQHSVHVPFCEPIGAGPHTVEVKIQGTMLGETVGSPSAGSGTGEIFRYGPRLLWLRNRYR
jgi:hypothetical protein